MDWLAGRATDIALVLAGAIALVVGLSLWSSQRGIEGGVVTRGEIVDHVTKTDADHSRSRYPVIEFTDRYERTHRFESKIGGSGGGIEGRVGQVVKVRYDPENPSRAQWADQPGRWIPAAAVGVGVTLLLIELGLVTRRWIQGRDARDPGAEAAASP